MDWIIAISIAVHVVLFVGLTLVYLSFSRVASITQTAASTFIDKVAQLSADRQAMIGGATVKGVSQMTFEDSSDRVYTGIAFFVPNGDVPPTR